MQDEIVVVIVFDMARDEIVVLITVMKIVIQDGRIPSQAQSPFGIVGGLVQDGGGLPCLPSLAPGPRRVQRQTSEVGRTKVRGADWVAVGLIEEPGIGRTAGRSGPCSPVDSLCP